VITVSWEHGPALEYTVSFTVTESSGSGEGSNPDPDPDPGEDPEPEDPVDPGDTDNDPDPGDTTDPGEGNDPGEGGNTPTPGGGSGGGSNPGGNNPAAAPDPTDDIDPIGDQGGTLAPSPANQAPAETNDNNSNDQNSGRTNSAQAQRAETLDALKAMNMPTMNIGNLEIPLFGPVGFATWALLNLLLALFCLIVGFTSGLSLWADRKNRAIPGAVVQWRRGDDKLKIALIAIGLLTTILFLLMEDVSNLMVLTDSLTPPMAVIAAAQGVLTHRAFGKHAKRTPPARGLAAK
jgi:hypothetical protein